MCTVRSALPLWGSITLKRLHSRGAGRHSSTMRVGAGFCSGATAVGGGAAVATARPPSGMPRTWGVPLLAKRLAIAATMACADAADTPWEAEAAAAGVAAAALSCSPACKIGFCTASVSADGCWKLLASRFFNLDLSPSAMPVKFGRADWLPEGTKPEYCTGSGGGTKAGPRAGLGTDDGRAASPSTLPLSSADSGTDRRATADAL